jgi:hypothetical protein
MFGRVITSFWHGMIISTKFTGEILLGITELDQSS